MPRVGRTSRYAGRNPINFFQVFIINSIDAKSAFLHHSVRVIVFAGAIGTGPRAEFAANARVCIYEYYPVLFALVGSTGRTDSDACGFFAMQARSWKMDGATILVLGYLITMYSIEPNSPGSIILTIIFL